MTRTKCVPEHGPTQTVCNVTWAKGLILAPTQDVYWKTPCCKDVHDYNLFNSFAVHHDRYLVALVQCAFNCCKVRRQSTRVRMLASLSRGGDNVVKLLLAMCGSQFYIGFSREEKGCANQATVVVIDRIPQEGRENYPKSYNQSQTEPKYILEFRIK